MNLLIKFIYDSMVFSLSEKSRESWVSNDSEYFSVAHMSTKFVAFIELEPIGKYQGRRGRSMI